MRDPVEAPMCQCGCGLPVRSKRNGVWSRWRHGHAYTARSSGAVPTDLTAPGPPHPPRDLQLSLWPETYPPFEL